MSTTVQSVVAQRLRTAREAFRQQRLAHTQRRCWMFYLEHNLIDEADGARQLMLEHLRAACQQWRLTLGTARPR